MTKINKLRKLLTDLIINFWIIGFALGWIVFFLLFVMVKYKG
jgi:uncharacterized membrane protein YciS (DUF1049 family)